MGKILPVLLALIGLGVGVGAGFMLKPPAEVAMEKPSGDSAAGAVVPSGVHPVATPSGEEGATSDFVKMNNQFVIPVVQDGSVAALVVLSLSLEVKTGANEEVYKREPKLRDAFLQVLFDHANTGGFDGVFTDGVKLASLRAALHEVAGKTLGPTVIDVLVTDIVRQDI